jgi:endoribonuclease Dicer
MSNVIRKKPKNPVTQLFEKFPEEVTFEKPFLTKSKTMSMVVMVGPKKDKFRGIGPNKKTAKLAAAKCALRELKKRRQI